MLQLALPLVAVMLAGLCIALETPTNAFLTKTSGSAIVASLASFLVGAVVLAGIVLVLRPKLSSGWTAATPSYVWIGGVYGAVAVAASAWATPKLNAGTTLVVIVATQVGLGVLLDHFGLIGLKHHPAGWMRLCGVAVVAIGALLVGLG